MMSVDVILLLPEQGSIASGWMSVVSKAQPCNKVNGDEYPDQTNSQRYLLMTRVRRVARIGLLMLLLGGNAGCTLSLPDKVPTPSATSALSGNEATKTPILIRLETPTLFPMCTPPPCSEDEAYHCPGECPGGCGTVCATHTPDPAE